MHLSFSVCVQFDQILWEQEIESHFRIIADLYLAAVAYPHSFIECGG